MSELFCTNPLLPKGCKAAVMGGGITGQAAAEYALSCGAQVRLSDSREREKLHNIDKLEEMGVTLSCGGHSLDVLQWADIVLLSPGISYNDPMVQLVRGRGISVYGELALLAEQMKGSMVIAVTGSNGKTTVTSLIGWVLEQSGRDTFIGGNIGVPLYRYCRQLGLGERRVAECIVAEVSSFQLECCGAFAPDIALLLNISPDHLDRHSMAGYIAAKMNIFASQQGFSQNRLKRSSQTSSPQSACQNGCQSGWQTGQCGIINGDDSNCQNLSPDFQGEFLSFGRRLFNNAIIEEGRVLLVEEGRRKPLTLPEGGGCGFSAENFAAAALALRRAGVSFNEIEEGFRTFKRPPHRLEVVAEKGGVLYVNDSKATNTGAVIGALEQFDRPVILIVGGRDKGEDYRLLRNAVQERVKAVIVIGEAAEDIAAALGECAEIFRADSMAEAVKQAESIASAGDVVLLSPACASFDMFSGYDERGRVFCQSVAQLEER